MGHILRCSSEGLAPEYFEQLLADFRRLLADDRSSVQARDDACLALRGLAPALRDEPREARSLLSAFNALQEEWLGTRDAFIKVDPSFSALGDLRASTWADYVQRRERAFWAWVTNNGITDPSAACSGSLLDAFCLEEAWVLDPATFEKEKARQLALWPTPSR
jgi:hypothetical protein